MFICNEFTLVLCIRLLKFELEIMASPYYTEKELANIKNYKAGTTIDKSLIYQYLVSPFCAKLVQYLPSWLAYVLDSFTTLIYF